MLMRISLLSASLAIALAACAGPDPQPVPTAVQDSHAARPTAAAKPRRQSHALTTTGQGAVEQRLLPEAEPFPMPRR
jgi:hypothetical protein